MRKTLLFLFLFFLLNNIYAQNLIPFYKQGNFGLCDYDGNIVIEPIYDYVTFYKKDIEGYLIQKNGRYGLLDKNLKVIFEPQFTNTISKIENRYVVENSNSVEYYSSETFKLISIETLTNENNFISHRPYSPRKEEEIFTHNRASVLKAFLVKTKLAENKYRVVDNNGTFFSIYDNETNKKIGIFLPKSEIFFIDDENSTYFGPRWIPSKQKYFLQVETKFGISVIDEDKNVVLPEKSNTSYFINSNHIEIYENNGNIETKLLYILNSKKIIENKYDGFRFAETIFVKNKPFDIFLTDKVNRKTNYYDKCFIGENGKEFFVD